MRRKSAPYWLAAWLLLIPIPFFFPVWTLDFAPYYHQFSSLSFYPHYLVALVLVWLGRDKFRRGWLRPLGLTIPLLTLVALTAASTLFSAVHGGLAVMMLARLVISLTLYFALQSAAFRPNHLFFPLILFIFVQSSAAIAQYLLQDDLGLRFLGELDLAPEPGRGSIIFGRDQFWLRGYGLTPHPNILGGLLGSALLVVFFWWDGLSKDWTRWFAPVTVFCGTLGLLVTFSRSAWLGTAVGLLAGLAFSVLNAYRRDISLPLQMFAFGRRFLPVVLPLILAVAIFLPAARGPLQARSQPQENQIVTQSVGERQLLIEVAFDFISDNFPFGLGAGNFAPAMLTHPDRESFPNIHPVHNVPLLLTAELGLLGGLMWLWLMLFPAGYGVYAWLWGRLTPLAVGLIAALIALAVIDLFDYYSWGWPHGLTWRWMLFALLAKAIGSQRP